MTIDERLQRWTVEHRVDLLDGPFVALSYAGSFGGLWLALAAAVALARRRADVLLLAVAAVALADAAAGALKAVIGRPRPYVAFPAQDPLLTAAFEYSLPSGHAATSFAGATVLLRFAPRLAPVLLVLAAAVAWSRVYVGVHYPSDVVAGAVLGAGVAGLLLLASSRMRARASAASRRPANDDDQSATGR